MADKDTYNVQELAVALGLSLCTIYRKLRRNEIRHTHVNEKSHHACRIPADEYERLVRGRPEPPV